MLQDQHERLMKERQKQHEELLKIRQAEHECLLWEVERRQGDLMREKWENWKAEEDQKSERSMDGTRQDIGTANQYSATRQEPIRREPESSQPKLMRADGLGGAGEDPPSYESSLPQHEKHARGNTSLGTVGRALRRWRIGVGKFLLEG